jgi:hypothetical protein
MRSEEIILTLRPEPGDFTAPPDVRLRKLLKILLRVFGWRCVAIDYGRPTPAPPVAADGAGGVQDR